MSVACQRGCRGIIAQDDEAATAQRLTEMLFYERPVFVRGRLAQAQQQSEAMIAAERLHQSALRANGGIKTGTAGTCRLAACFFFFFFPLLGHCSICAPPAPL